MGNDPFSFLRSQSPFSSPFDDATPGGGTADTGGLSPEEEARLELELSGYAAPGSLTKAPAGDRGALRSLWDYSTSPLRALGGVTGTSLVQLAKPLFPASYEAAAKELRADESQRAGPEVLRDAASLPGFGDVAVQGLSPEFRASLGGRIAEPITRLGLNILGDPTSYVGAGILTQASKVGRATQALSRAQKGLEAATAAGKAEAVAELSSRIPGLAGRLAQAAGEESVVGRGARRLVEGVESLGQSGAGGRALAEAAARPSLTSFARPLATLPFGPAAALPYAPDIIEGTVGGLGRAADELREGRYAEAASEGLGAVLTGGLGLLVSRGVISEARANQVARRALAEQLGEGVRPELLTPPGGLEVGAPSTEAVARTAQEPAPPPEAVAPPPGAAPGPTPQVPPTPPPAAVAAPAAGPAPVAPTAAQPQQVVPPPGLTVPPLTAPGTQVEPPALTPSPDASRLKVDRSPKTQDALARVIEAKSAQTGQYLTKRDLLDAGLVTPKQAKSYPLETLLDALGGTDFRSRLESVPGLGFRVRSGEAAPVAPAAAPQPAAPAVESMTVGGAVGEQPVAPPGPQSIVPPATPPVAAPEAAPARKALTFAEIDRQLQNPELRSMVDRTLDEMSGGRDVLALSKKDVTERFPGPENKDTRALMYRALEARKKIAKEQAKAEAAAQPQPDAALTFPGESRQPFRTPPALVPETRQEATGLLAERGRDVTGIGERRPPRDPDDPTITNAEELEAVRYQLEQVKRLRQEEPEAADELADLELGLQNAVDQAYATGSYLPPMEAPVRAPRPEPVEPREGLERQFALTNINRRPEETGRAEGTQREMLAERMVAGTRDFDAETRAARVRELMGTPQPRTPADPTAGVEAGRADRFTAAIGKHLVASDLNPATFEERVRRVTGRNLADLTHEQLSVVFTLADKNPGAFGTVKPLDPMTANEATLRLTGRTDHLADTESTDIGFRYDPASPAGQVQQYARQLEGRYGIPAEQTLQDALIRIISSLGQNDQRHLTRASAEIARLSTTAGAQATALRNAGDEAGAAKIEADMQTKARSVAERAAKRYENAVRRREMLTSPDVDPAAAKKELTKILHRSLRNGTIDYVRSESVKDPNTGKLTVRAAPIEEAITKAAVDGLDQDELQRTALAKHAVDLPDKPADLTAEQWLEQVRTDPGLRQRYINTLYAVAQQTAEGKAKRTGTKGISGSQMGVLREIAEDLGFKLDDRRGVQRALPMLARHITGAEPRAAVTELLNDQLVARRGDTWRQAVSRGTSLNADGSVKLVDLEGDVGDLHGRFWSGPNPLVDRLQTVAADIASRLGMPSRLGGFSLSPQLQGLRLDDAVYLNPLHARHSAIAEMADSTLQGDARAAAIDHKTAQNMVDVLIHEITHTKARHDARAGDVDFTTAYANAIRDLGPVYAETVRAVRDSIGKELQLDERMPDYTQALDRLRTEIESGAIAQGDLARPGQGGAPAVGARPGGDPRGAALGVPGGPRPIRPIPPGREGEAGAVQPGAAAGQGAAGGAPVEPGGAGRGRGDADPSASLTTNLSQSIANRRRDEVFSDIQRKFASNMARFGGTPESAERYLAMIEDIKRMPESARLAFRVAKPQGQMDIGKNLNKIPMDAMSDEQKEQIGVALTLYNHLFSRATPMKESDVRSAMKRLLDTHTPEEFVDWAKVKGIKNPAEMALLDTVISTFGREVDDWTGRVRAADIEIKNAQRHGLTAALKEAESKRETAIDNLAHAHSRRDAAIFTLIPHTTNVARMLAFRRMMFHPLGPGETFKARFLGAMRASGLKKEKAQEFYTMLQDTIAQGPGADWGRFVGAFRQATQPKFFDKFLEFWKAGLLGLPTQIVNIGTNAAFLGYRNAENAVSSLANTFFQGLTGAPRTRFLGENAARFTGGRHGLVDAVSHLKSDLGDVLKLRPPDIQRRLTEGTFFDDPNIRQLYGAIGGKTGEFVRIPFKLLDAFDRFFKEIIRNQEWGAQAHRLAAQGARQPGEAVGHATGRIYDELRRVSRDPIGNYGLFKKPGYKDALEAGRKAAIDDTFQAQLVGTPMREAVRAYQRGTQALPALQFVTPFIKTPYNILAEAMKRTPMAAAWAIKKWHSGEIDDPAFVEAMVKSSIGTAVMATVFEAAVNGDITGGGPVDPKEAELLKRTGWQPRSIKIGNNYYSYQRLAPFSVVFGAAADMAEAYQRKDTDSASELLQKGVASVSDNIFDQSFIQGLDSAMKIATDPQRQGLAAMRSLQASLVPNVVGVVPVAHAARAMDPYYRETEAFTTSPFEAQIPGLSQNLQPQLTPTGEPRERKGTMLERLLSPIQRSEIKNDPEARASAELARVGPLIEQPPLFFRVGPEKVYYSPDERQAIAQAQQRAIARIAQVINRPDYKALPDVEDVSRPNQRTKRDVLQRIFNEVRRPVVDRVNRQARRRTIGEERLASLE